MANGEFSEMTFETNKQLTYMNIYFESSSVK